MKKIFDIFYSTRLTAVLFIVYSVAMGVATFIENDYGTQTAKALVYNAWWFEAIMVFFVINFFGNIFRYRLLRKEKWPVLLFHVSFLLILIGAGITRYVGYEGLMLINEGQTSEEFLSETTYLNVVVDNNEVQKTFHKSTLFSAKGDNNWSLDEEFKDQLFSIKLSKYIPWAEEQFVENETGDEYLFIVESSSGSRHEHYIKKGELQNIHGVLVGFEAPNNSGTINLFREDGILKIQTRNTGTWMRMADRAEGTIIKDSVQEFQLRSLYRVGDLPFVIPEPVKKGALKTVRGAKKDDTKLDALLLDITVDEETKQIELYGGKYAPQRPTAFSLNGLNFRIDYGPQILKTPFEIKLNDFQLEKYPGSESAAAFASEITVIDPDETFDYRIYMNHILDHKGYKFFQASYDLSGEVEQTHLSVNHDFWGTLISYMGYSLLYIGMISILFAPGTRFDSLKKTLKKIKKKKAALLLFIGLFISFTGTAQTQNDHLTKITDQQIDSVLLGNLVELKHAEEFNTLIIQDFGGRMKPAHTFASELVRKVFHNDDFNGIDPSQVFLSIIENSKLWFNVPFIYLEKGNTEIREIIGVDKDVTHAALADFYEGTESKISEYVVEAQKKNVQNKFEKDVIKIDRRIYLFSQALSLSVLRIYPKLNDENNKWVSYPEGSRANYTGKDSLFVRQSLPIYIRLLQDAKRTNNYTEANKLIAGIKKFQQKYGEDVYPNKKKIDLEITYNKLQIFKKLAKYYGFTSIFLIFFVILQIFNDKKWITKVVKFLIGITIILFGLHIMGLMSRWYISGNAPWSNAYESIIYVAWATMLFGLAFGRKSSLTIAATTFLTAVILGFAHQNWLDPEIANLQPVLNSWWLLVHVSIIVASYGPFSLGMILGIVALFLTIFTTKKNKKKMDLNIKEITTINEMAITIGLIMLTIGNFLGGMWANESWGRYWGWDPKETWALVSIMVYAFVLHMRLIPGLRSRYTFNLWSIISYGSIMMTYFGVNFYLSGLHSYASGDQVITPNSVFYSVGFVLILGTLAWFKHRKFYKK
ncbi:cytochrome c biogenesis protein CcsA [Flavobacteriaceae bacterium]|jgi:cytochrome c-type biogenesis protein CcsB|nr:cytochrome c biogenesis protein CcsA [Flavobacteriaceae bacterium]MDC3227518.1 cytochrome c biogenesis protein CcsA [bacterium]